MEYYEAITVLDAQSRLVEMNISEYPRMTTDGRKKFHREMRKKGFPEHLRSQMSFEDFARKMNRG